jgi:hypothetical protein
MTLLKQFFEKNTLSKDDVIDYQLKHADFSQVAQFYDQVAPYRIGYLGKSIAEAKQWGIWEMRADSGANYIGFYKSQDEALDVWKQLTGDNQTSYTPPKEIPVVKSVENLSSEGEWFFVQGQKVLVNEFGVVVKGPDIFIGQPYEYLSVIPKLTMAEILQAWNYGNTHYFATEQANELELEQRVFSKSQAKIALEKAIEKMKNSPYRYNKD